MNMRMSLHLLLLSMLTSNFAYAFDCTIAKSISVDEKTRSTTYGNAIAISQTEFLINDHSLSADAKSVSLRFKSGRSTLALIEKRDFHTDLALLRIDPNNDIKVCKLDNQSTPTSGLMVEIQGFENKSDSFLSVRAEIINKNSDRLEVPGILSSIEVGGQNSGTPMRASMSGAPAFNQDGVIGILTQKTPEGTGLLIPAQQITHILRQMRSNSLPKRNYSYNYRSKKFQFQGLELSAEDQFEISGNPHEGEISALVKSLGGNPHEGKIANHRKLDLLNGGNPHEGDRAPWTSGKGVYGSSGNLPIGLHDLELGFAVAKVSNMALLLKYQPQIGQIISHSTTKTIFIRSIDGIEIKNLFQFIRVLGTCTDCAIDNFWVESTNPKELGNKYLQGVGLISQLLNSLEHRGEGAPAQRLLPSLSRLNQAFVRLARDFEVYGSASNQQIKEADQALENLEQNLLDIYLSVDQLDLLNEIRMVIAR